MIAVVTGSSSGIGYAICELLRDRGYKVYGFSRRGSVPEGCVGFAVDIADETAVKKAIDKIAADGQRIDVLVNNAGMGIAGPIEFTSKDDARLIVDINFMGQFYCTAAVLPYMRKQNAGHIVFVSSVAGSIAIPYQGFYSATKAATNAFALSLRNEVKDYNIAVCAVEPGDTVTGFTDERKKDASGLDAYPHCEASLASMEKDERNGMSASFVAHLVVKAAEKKNPKPLYVTGIKYKVFYMLFKFLPSRLAYWIVSKMY